MTSATDIVKRNNRGMKVRDLIKRLKTCDGDADILLGSDEELNTLYQQIEINKLAGTKKKSCVIFGYSGSELEEYDKL